MSSGGAGLTAGAPAATTSKGREQRRTTATAKARTPDLSKWYNTALPPQHPGDYQFRLDLLRPGLTPFRLDKMVDTLGWTDETTVLTGSLSAYRPDPEKPATLPLGRGDLVRCTVKWAAQAYRLWTMRVQAPQPELDTGNTSVTLQDDMALLDSSKLDWFFRKSKAKKFGYTADEITIAVAQRLGVGIDTLPKGTQRFALVERNMTGLAVLKAAWSKEKTATGVGYVIRLRNGKLQIVPIRRNPLLYVLGPQIQTALLTQKTGSKVPTTVLEGHGHIGKGKGAQKVSYTEYDRSVVDTLGYVHQVKQYGEVRSHADLRAQVKLDYAAGIRVNDLITVDHAGIPFIYRGDGTQLKLPGEGYKGAQSFVYCTRAAHTVQAATYTTEWDFTLTDPFLAQQESEQKAAAARATKRGQRSRNLTGTGGWITVDATYFSPGDAGGPPACGGDFSFNGGMFYAELGFSGGAGQKMGPLFGMTELPCGFPLEIMNPVNGRSVIALKHDTGGGAPGANIDLWVTVADALSFTSIGHGPVKIRKAS